ncbi:MAG: DUF302 domain-containing protein [Cyclobacteriaceae bacterium]
MLRTMFTPILSTIIILSSVSMFQCENETELMMRPGRTLSDNGVPKATKLVYAEAKNQSASSVYGDIVSALEANPNIGIVAEVDHQANAASVGLDLPPTNVVLFGNPNLGTPLMQENQQAGLDLPQKILVYDNGSGRTFAAYNDVAYLAERHGVAGVETLNKIEGALTNLVENVTGGSAKTTRQKKIALNEGVITVSSNRSFDETYEQLRAAIEGNSNLKIVAELDHQANAASEGLTLNPTKLIVFGNPNLGTPLMQENQTIGIDLPQKMLVYEKENGDVLIAYNDPYFLADRHDIKNSDDILNKISNALANLAATAANN